MEGSLEKPGLGGLKISGELCLLRVGGDSDFVQDFSRLRAELAQDEVNLPFLATCRTGDEPKASLCFQAGAKDRVERLIEADERFRGRCEIITDVGTLTLYPVRSRLNILGFALAALDKGDLWPYALASSLSTLTFVLPEKDLEKAVGYFKDCFSWPQNHSPVEASPMLEPGPESDNE